MEDQGRELGKRHLGVGLHLHHLSGGKAGHGHLVEVVGRATVSEFASLVLLEIKSIKPIVHHTLTNVLCVLHMHHAYLGMKRRHPLIVVKVVYGIEKNLFHLYFIISETQELISFPLTLFSSLPVCHLTFG